MGKKDYPSEEKSGEVARLKRHIRHQDKEIARLKSELRTYERVFNKNITFLKEKTHNLSLEELIAGANAELTAQQITEEKVNKYSDLERKWKCFQCGDGVLKLIIIPRGLENAYFRKCSNKDCDHRTPAKTYTEDIDGIK